MKKVCTRPVLGLALLCLGIPALTGCVSPAGSADTPAPVIRPTPQPRLASFRPMCRMEITADADQALSETLFRQCTDEGCPPVWRRLAISNSVKAELLRTRLVGEILRGKLCETF